jgi:hypothetical protein
LRLLENIISQASSSHRHVVSGGKAIEKSINTFSSLYDDDEHDEEARKK